MNDYAPLFTENGRRVLGQLIRSCREQKGWSLDDLVFQIRVATGHKISKTTISNLERGSSSPSWDTLALLASAEYIHLYSSAELIDAHAMIDIACEAVDPTTGKTKRIGKASVLNASEDGENYGPSNQPLAFGI